MPDTVAHFSIHYYHYLEATGSLRVPLPPFANDDTLISLYHTMQLVRCFDNKAIALQRTGKLGTYAPIRGHEALSTAIGFAMAREDAFFPYYRDYATQLMRGVCLTELFHYWGGDEIGNRYQHQPHDFPIAVPIASQCLHAAGAAFAFQYQGKPQVAVTTVGDGGTSEGEFYEAINVAGAWQLPVVFIINNNQWAISVPREKQTHCHTLAQKAIAAGFHGEQVDGNDILACIDRLQQAIANARDGQGPQLIEAMTHRLGDHTTADDSSRYRCPSRKEHAETLEPIRRLRRLLQRQCGWDDAQETACLEYCQQQVNAAAESYVNQAPQPLAEIFDHHYQVLPPCLQEQRQHCLNAVSHD